MLKSAKSRFTHEERIAIVYEFERSNLSGEEIARKYGIKYPSLIANWRKSHIKVVIRFAKVRKK